MTESRTRSISDKALRAVAWSLRTLVITTTALVVLGVLNVVVHTYLHVCPLHLARFDERAIVPVVYGLPMGGELFERAARGEIVLGGCVRRELDGVCPYCRWPAKFRGDEPEDGAMGSDPMEPGSNRHGVRPHGHYFAGVRSDFPYQRPPSMRRNRRGSPAAPNRRSSAPVTSYFASVFICGDVMARRSPVTVQVDGRSLVGSLNCIVPSAR